MGPRDKPEDDGFLLEDDGVLLENDGVLLEDDGGFFIAPRST